MTTPIMPDIVCFQGKIVNVQKNILDISRTAAKLPALEAALSGREAGRPMGKVAALAIARVASAESIDAWIGLARAASNRRLRGIVNASRSVGPAWPRHIGDARQEQDESPSAAPTC